MTLLYKHEHLVCELYSKPENRVFSIVTLECGERLFRENFSVTMLFFLVEGSMEVSCGDLEKSYKVTAGNFFLIPKGSTACGQVLEKGKIVACVFTGDLKLCSRFSLQQLGNYLPEDFAYCFQLLPFNGYIRSFLDMLQIALEDGLGCVHFHELKRDELFLYLRGGYSKEQLAAFFYPVVAQKMDFKDFVLSNYKSVKDVKEFADKANLSLSTFNRRFKEAFRESAYKWMTSRKSEDVLKDILMTELPFAEVAEKYGFSSPGHLVVFCKKHYGKTPNELRTEGMIKNTNQELSQ